VPSEPVTRKRKRQYGQSAHLGPSSLYRTKVGSGLPLSPYKAAGPQLIRGGFQFTESQGHPFQALKHERPVQDLGGPFYTIVNEVENFSSECQARWKGSDPSGTYEFSYRGPIGFNVSLGSDAGGSFVVFPPSPESSTSQLNKDGATFVHNCSPLNPVSSLQTAVGEILKDGFPAIPGIRTWRDRTLNLVHAGDEFLNFVFGWEPLIHDVREVAGAARQAAEVIQQYQRDAGKLVRRGEDWDTEQTVSDNVVSMALRTNNTGFDSTFVASSGRVRVRSVTKRRKWFRGAFTYHIPDSIVGNVLGAAPTAEKLFGSSLTPETLWELTPWSWAIDWFSNASSVFSNLTQMSQLGLVMPYGYVMEESMTETTYTLQSGGFIEGLIGPAPVVSPMILRTRVKKRIRANPFGFGVEWKGLSPLQIAILVALGITRGSA
jgi:hypothetical protein